jgi:CoA-transferase family III
VEVAIARHDEESLLALLAKADVPAVSVNTIDRVLSDPQCTACEMVERVPHPTLGEVPIVGVPVKFSEMRPRVRTHAPRLGEHTDEVLAEHGYSAAEIAELRARRIVALRTPRITGRPEAATDQPHVVPPGESPITIRRPDLRPRSEIGQLTNIYVIG